MIKLTRETRFNLVDADAIDFGQRPPINNSWGGWPAASQVSPYFVFRATVVGEPDQKTGYLCNIKDIDHALRESVIQAHIVCPGFNSGKSLVEFLRVSWHHLRQVDFTPATLTTLVLCVTPTLKMSIDYDRDSKMTLTQQFEFSAAHRLHVDSMSQQENRDYFGKCNNPNGHGHNYVVEVSLETDTNASRAISLDRFEATVKENVIDVLDHKHLNLDVEYFKDVNPTVENIAIAVWQWLDGKFGDAKLKNVRIYETPKTWADYCG